MILYWELILLPDAERIHPKSLLASWNFIIIFPFTYILFEIYNFTRNFAILRGTTRREIPFFLFWSESYNNIKWKVEFN